MCTHNEPMKNVLLKERKLSSGKISFYIQYFEQGDRKRETIDLAPVQKFKDSGALTREYKESKRLADILRSRRHEDLLQNKVKLSFKEDKMKLFMYVEQYRQNYKRKDFRKVNAMQNYLERFTTDLRITLIDRRFVIDFRDFLLQSLKPDAARNYLAIFKKILDRAVFDSIIKFNVSRDVTIKVKGISSSRLVKDVLSIDELRTLNTTFCGNEDVKAAFLFACNTGITLSELKELKWSQIRDEKLHYARHKTDDEITVEVDLNENALHILEGRSKKNNSDLIFSNLGSTNGVNKTLKNWVVRAAIEKHITFYCARHTFGTLQALNGVNQAVIAQNMGHTSTTHTDKYINKVDKAKKVAVQFESIM